MQTYQKYILSNQTKTNDNGVLLYRIISIKDFYNAKAGEYGGWVESEENLSQYGTCWIKDEAEVFGKAEISEDAIISGAAKVYGDAKVYDNADIYGHAKVYGNATVCGYAKLGGYTEVFENAKVGTYTHSLGKPKIYGNAQVFGSIEIAGNPEIYGKAHIKDTVFITGDAKIYGNVVVSGDAFICGNAEISKLDDYIVFKNWWSSGRYFTWTRSNNMWRAGCFYGTAEQLIEKAYLDSEKSGQEYEKIVKYVENIFLNFNNEKYKKCDSIKHSERKRILFSTGEDANHIMTRFYNSMYCIIYTVVITFLLLYIICK